MLEKRLIVVGVMGFMLLCLLALFVSIKIGFLLFAGGILVAVVFFKPFWGLLLYLALLYIRPQEFVESMRAQPIMLLLAILVLGTLIIHNAIQKRKLFALEIRQGIFMIAFFAVIVLSQLQTLYLAGTRMAFDSFLPVFLLFFMVVNLVATFDELKRTYYLLFGMTVFLAANGILQYYRGYDIAGQVPFQGRIRWIGIFEDPNDLGLAILSFTPFAFLKLVHRSTGWKSRIAFACILGVLLYALYLTNSRGTVIGLLVVIAYLFSRTYGILRGLAISVVLGAVLLVAGPSRLSEMSAGEASASGRIEAWDQGLMMLISHPVLGVGYMNFTNYHPLTAHNSVVLCMAELGIVGLYVWLFLIVASFEEMLAAEKRAGGEYAFFGRVMQTSLIGFFAAGFFLSRTYNEVLYIMIALCALISRFARDARGYRVPFISGGLALTVLGIAIGLIVLVRVLVLF